MKTKLIPCPKITKRELMTALMEGRKFMSNPENMHLSLAEIHWDDNFGINPVRTGVARWNWRGFKYLHEIVEQKWWEDPDMVGKPVKVRDNLKDEWSYDFFGSFSKSSIHTFNCIHETWAFCEPLTAADLYQGEV